MAHLPEALLTGYRNFMSGRYPAESGRYRALAREGQAPETMVIACCDSRAAPEAIFDAGPGELFVVRNVANLVPPYAPDGEFHSTSAALEFAVQSLKVKQHRGDGPWPLRRHPRRARSRRRAAVAGRFHRQVDEPGRAGGAKPCRATR